MTSSSELTGRQKAVELLRWILVLPAAALGGFAVRCISVLVSRLAEYGWGTATESNCVYYLQLVMFYVLKEAAFVIAGAKMAPRSRPATAIALAIAGILMSLLGHVLGQSHPGSTNYTHFAAESAGAALGAAYIFYSERRRPNRSTSSAPDDLESPAKRS